MSRESTCVDVIKSTISMWRNQWGEGLYLQLEISGNEGEMDRTQYGVKRKDVREYPGTTPPPIREILYKLLRYFRSSSFLVGFLIVALSKYLRYVAWSCLCSLFSRHYISAAEISSIYGGMFHASSSLCHTLGFLKYYINFTGHNVVVWLVSWSNFFHLMFRLL